MRQTLIYLSLTFLLGGLCHPLFAKDDKGHKDDSCRLIGSQQAAEQATRKTGGGKVVSIKLEKSGASSVYRVRVLVDEKRVKNISIKACKK